jgi:hypothetical protein
MSTIWNAMEASSVLRPLTIRSSGCGRRNLPPGGPKGVVLHATGSERGKGGAISGAYPRGPQGNGRDGGQRTSDAAAPGGINHGWAPVRSTN